MEFEVISFEKWRQCIQPLWPWNTDYHWIPIYNNPYGMVQYRGQEVFDRMIVFPVMCTVDGEPAAFTQVYNISDTHVRIRGIYVDPKFRGQRLVNPMVTWAVNLFPEPWHTAIGYYRTNNVDYFKKVFFDGEVEEYGWRQRIVNGKREGDYDIILLQKRIR